MTTKVFRNDVTVSSTKVGDVTLVIDVQDLNGSIVFVNDVKVDGSSGADLHRCVLFHIVVIIIALVLWGQIQLKVLSYFNCWAVSNSVNLSL